MSIFDLSDNDAVLQAIAEFDSVGREEFLEKYNFGPSKKFFLIYKGKRYDSKAILGAAYGFQYPDRGPISYDKFKGGDETISVLGRKLGFIVVEDNPEEGMIRHLVHELNELAPNYATGALQALRERRLGHKTVTQRLFTGQTTHDNYAFHSGGRQELQFNIGTEEDGAKIRYGVAFSLELSFALKDISILLPKIEKFNEYLRRHSKEFDDLRMWVWEKDGSRTSEYTPSEITPAIAIPGKFIFLGTLSDATSINPMAVLALFDRLLPLYQYTEGDVNSSDDMIPRVGDILTNGDISAIFGVGLMGGMRRNLQRHLLILISDPFKSLYRDRWEENILHYTGMGPDGDQSLTYSQNRTLAESKTNGITVYLLEALSPQQYTFAGQAELVDHPYQEEQTDSTGTPRRVWMFPLRLIGQGRVPEPTIKQMKDLEDAQTQFAKKLNMDELKKQAQVGRKQPSRRPVQAIAYERNPAIVELVKRLANGVCDLCHLSAPFNNKRNEAYLECHHVIWLAEGGADDLTNTVALCPNCHRKMHVLNLAKDRKLLLNHAIERNQAHGLIFTQQDDK